MTGAGALSPRGRAPALALCAATVILIGLSSALAAEGGRHAPSEVVFLAEIILLLVCGRLLGELMQRIGQPAVMGQLIAGIVLGPSVFGALLPELQQVVFPKSPEQKSMIDAVSQLGILMLLLLTGMETDVALVKRTRGAALAVSIAGISVPFVSGVVLGWLLPVSMLPHPDQRVITALFLGTALSISSVKIVAMVVREMNFMRRTLGQVIVAAAIIDDTIGWIIIAVISGLAAHGAIDLISLGRSVFGTVLFLAVSFSIGRRLVFRLIRWANDTLVSDLPVITTILVVMGVMGLITHALGVHTVLGAFVAGILVGQSPILTRHIDEQLRGLIVALFMPVFFGLAGLNADIGALADTSQLLLLLGLILIASIGKFSGAFLGGALGGLTWREALALGCGMNARGSTEVIVASIGLSMGALSQNLYTMIVAMAVVTTMAMPPMLRAALRRLPLRPEEKRRLERESFEAEGFVTNIERLLVAADESKSGRFALCLAGLLAGSRRIPTTLLSVGGATRQSREQAAARAEQVEAIAKATAEVVESDGAEIATAPAPVDITSRPQNQPAEEAVAREASKGYDLLIVGAEPVSVDSEFHPKIARIAAGFDGPLAIAAARGVHRKDLVGGELHILVPVTGSSRSQRGAEIALVLARASAGSVTALHVAGGRTRPWRRRLGASWAGSHGEAILREVVSLGDRVGVPVRTVVRRRGGAEDAILRQLETGAHNLVVMGVSRRTGKTLFFGDVPAAVLDRADRSILFVAS
jgi:Kef-type K+ transport system membrane component KefB/nucleotide-binding universal stress UspA family protein